MRDLSALADRAFDVAVVGGGIYGLCAVREAARRGFTACLVERGDFVGATSSNSLKIMHGGLRYLQHGDVPRMRESIRERRLMLRFAPHLVRPLPFVLPTHGHGLRGKTIMRAALALNDLIGSDRSAGVLPARRIPRGRVIGRDEVHKLVPGLEGPGLSGAAIWYDCLVANTERLAFAFLHDATRAGAVCANYVEATGLLLDSGGVEGVDVRDHLSGERFQVRARAVLNTTGPWVDRLAPKVPGVTLGRRFHPSKAMNLVTRSLLGPHAVGFTVPVGFSDTDALINKGDRVFFVVPWKSYSLIGTRHLPYRGEPDDFRITEEDVQRFVAEINSAYPCANLDRSEVLTVLSGMLPEVPRGDTDEVQLVKHSRVHDHAAEGRPGLLSTVGVKWTTARRAAEQALDMVEARLRPGARPHRVPEGPLPGGDMQDVDRFVEEGIATRPESVTAESMRHLLETYGTECREVLTHVRQHPALGRPLASPSPVIGGEVVHGAVREMAQHLDDVVLRRTELAVGGHPGREALSRCADLLAGVLGWSPSRREQELERAEAALRRSFALPSRGEAV